MAVESSKMTRNQVHEKLKENFQALYARCPQVVRFQIFLNKFSCWLTIVIL